MCTPGGLELLEQVSWPGMEKAPRGKEGLEHEQRGEHFIKHTQIVASKGLGTKHEERQCPVL